MPVPVGRVIRADERFRSEHDGIVSLHCFSAGAHYDPERMGVGALIAIDEHLLAPGAGFAEHAHRAVVIVSLVLEGALRHASSGEHCVVEAGGLLVQDCGSGIRHAEGNASAVDPLRLLQITMLADASRPPATYVPDTYVPDTLSGDFPVEWRLVCRHSTDKSPLNVEGAGFGYVVDGPARIDGYDLGSGDAASWADSTFELGGRAVVWPGLG